MFLAHALIDTREATLFVGAGKISTELQAALLQDGVQVADYAHARAALAACLPALSCCWTPSA